MMFPFRRSLLALFFALTQLTAIASAAGNLGAVPPGAKKADAPAVIGKMEGLPGNPLIVAPLLLSAATLNLPIVQVSINNSKPLYFIFDTGAGELFLAPWAIQELRVKAMPEKLGKDITQVPEVSIALIGRKGEMYKLPSAKPETMPDSLVNAFKQIKLAGIIGIDLVRQKAVRLDPAAQTMTLYASPDLPVRIRGATVVPLLPSTLIQGGFYRDALVHLSGDNTAAPVRMLLDTGSSNVVLPLSDARQVDSLRISRNKRAITTLYGTRSSFVALLPEITVGSRKEFDVSVSVVRTTNASPLLGMEFLLRFKTTLDFTHDQMLLEPITNSQNQKRERINGDTGVILASDNGKLVISQIDAGEPYAALGAGLRPLDSVETIDGIDVIKMDARSAAMLLPQRVGASSVLRVRHVEDKNGKPIEVTLTAVDPFSPVTKKLVFGFVVEGEETSGNGKFTLRVSSVAPNSGAADAGLRIGDQLVSVRGKLVSEMEATEAANFFKSPVSAEPFPVTVRRAGIKEPVTLAVAPKVQSSLDLLPWPDAAPETIPINPVVIPFQYEPPRARLMTVRARINSSPPLLFLVNTDLRNDIVLFSWALPQTELKLLPEKEQIARTSAGIGSARFTNPLKLRPEVDSASPGASVNYKYGIVIEELEAIRDYPEGRIAGIVGGNFLTLFNSIVDFDRKTISWVPVLPPEPTGSSTLVLPLKTVSSNTNGLYIEVTAAAAGDKEAKGSPITFLLDTGSTNSFLPRKFIGTGEDTKSGTLQRRLLFGAPGGVGSIDRGNITLYSGDDNAEPRLGLDVLSQFRITIDATRKQIRLTPRLENALP